MRGLRSLKTLINWPAIVKRKEGSSTIELAIVFPILLIMFVGTAELGRLFYTYNSLSKATKVGARYLSASRLAVNGTATEITNAKTEAKNLVVYGCKNRAVAPCSTASPIVNGLSTANINICDNFATPCSPVLAAGPVKYFRVEIQSFNYSAGTWSLATMTGKASSTFYFSLAPGTEMRSMQ